MLPNATWCSCDRAGVNRAPLRVLTSISSTDVLSWGNDLFLLIEDDSSDNNDPSGAGTTTRSSDVSNEDCKSIIRPADNRSSFICSCFNRLRSRDNSCSMASI